MDLLSGASDTGAMAEVLAYYRATAPLIAAGLDGSPLIYRNYPHGLDTDGICRSPLSANRILWAIHAKYAIEFFTWAPLPDDEDRLRFARILLE